MDLPGRMSLEERIEKKSDVAWQSLNPNLLSKYLSNWAEILDLGSPNIIVACSEFAAMVIF